MERQTLDAVIDTLFPTFRNSAGLAPLHADSPVPFTAVELEAAMYRIRSKNKAPGSDGITFKILSAVHKAARASCSGSSTNVFGLEPSRWSGRLLRWFSLGKETNQRESRRPTGHFAYSTTSGRCWNLCSLGD